MFNKPRWSLCLGPKAADRLEPKGEWPGAGAQRSSAADDAPPASRHDLTHSVASAERGKPVVSPPGKASRSEEHTSELQSRQYLVCRLLLEKKKIKQASCYNSAMAM